MASIPFTQFLRPDGRKREVSIERPTDIGVLAERIIISGYRFEVEELTNGKVSLTIANDDDDQDVEVVPNGPDVPAAVDRLVSRFAARLPA